MTGQQHDASRIRLVRRVERAAVLDRLGTIFTVVGGLLVALAGLVGAGALGVLAYRGWGGRRQAVARRAPAAPS